MSESLHSNVIWQPGKLGAQRLFCKVDARFSEDKECRGDSLFTLHMIDWARMTNINIAVASREPGGIEGMVLSNTTSVALSAVSSMIASQPKSCG